ncbi:MAG: glycosyltransferase [Actinomycetota bacterium]|nr:glycosyltransferase [Actinomycetota bacterium]
MTAGSGVKVSVVVPVYNPGERILGLIDSLIGQSLSPAEFEVVLVDDGSTDDTPARLEEACAAHPNMRVSTIPNSGWPGRPRNVGTDLAAGEYVFYCDNDDELYPEALERLYALASANDSDIVYGKIVRTGRPTPYWPLWKRTIAVADPVPDGIVQSRTVHKLFRRQFLIDHEIRFPEGRVRLEDFSFMGQAIPKAKVISVLADYPCYRWIHRPDGSNNSDAAVQQSTYWGYFVSALETMAANAGDGPLLDAARLIAVEQAFSRFPASTYLKRSQVSQAQLVDAVSDYIAAEVPATLDERLPVLKRLRVQALRDRDKARFDALQRLRLDVSVKFEVAELSWRGDTLHVDARATLHGADAVALMEPGAADGDLLLPVSPELLAAGVTGSRLLRPEDRGVFELTVRHRATGLEWPVECASSQQPDVTSGGVRLSVRVQAQICPARNVFGDPLGDGIWDLVGRAQFLGEGTVATLPAPGLRVGGTSAVGDRMAHAYVTKTGRLALKLAHETVGARSWKPSLHAATWGDGGLVLALSGLPAHGATIMVRHRDGGDGVSVPVHTGSASLPLSHVRDGAVADAYVRLESPAGVLDEQLRLGASLNVRQQAPYVLSANTSGGLAIRRLDPGEPLPSPLTTPAPARRRLRAPGPGGAAAAATLKFQLRRVARRARRLVKERR